jgi:Cu+-exporting ATPase
MLAAIDQRVVGAIAVADVVKPEAKQVVQKLKQMNVEVWMVTGDNRRTANAIGKGKLIILC